MISTKNNDYTIRLLRLQSQTWKQKLSFANPYKIHIRNVISGNVLEVGCGIGRVLNFMPHRIVGVDYNADSVKVCKDKGLVAYHTEEFLEVYKGRKCFDTILLSHVVEHMTVDEAVTLIKFYKQFLKKNANLILIAPQEKGYASDPTHVEFMDFSKLSEICVQSGFNIAKSYSFPFFRLLGKMYIYNEFVLIGKYVD